MSEINHITRNIHVGGDPIHSPDLGRDLALLRGEGAPEKGVPPIHLILDARSPREAARYPSWEAHAGMPPNRVVGMYDNGRDPNNITMFHRSRGMVEARARELSLAPKDVGLFVHCHLGVNRAPSLAMYLLMVFHGFSATDAFLLIRQKRPEAAVAYGALAIEASLDGQGDVGSAVQGWKAFEKKYWTYELMGAMGDAIRSSLRRNRQGTSDQTTPFQGEAM